MTSLKYRFWNYDTKRMYRVSGIGFEREVVVVWPSHADRIYHFDDGALLQFTGLTDKNGVEIYQGDLVCKQSRKPEVIEFTQTEGPDGGIIMGFVMPSASSEDMEVIGNIYENPELLEVNQGDRTQ